LAKWSVECSPKDQGGLGIHDLEIENTALLGKLLFKLLTEEEAWQTILKRNILAKKHYLRFFGNRGFTFLGWTHGNRKVFLWSGFFHH
jgi:hypothetical protein